MSHHEINENALFKITCQEDGSLRISTKMEPSEVLYMRFFTNLFVVPGIGFTSDDTSYSTTKWRFDALGDIYVPGPGEFNPPARRVQTSVPDEQYLSTRCSDAVYVIQYTVPVAGQGGDSRRHPYPRIREYSILPGNLFVNSLCSLNVKKAATNRPFY